MTDHRKIGLDLDAPAKPLPDSYVDDRGNPTGECGMTQRAELWARAYDAALIGYLVGSIGYDKEEIAKLCAEHADTKIALIEEREK